MNITIKIKKYITAFCKGIFVIQLKFISTVRLGQELVGETKIQKKTKSMVFLTCELSVEDKIVATASGVWKILKKLPGTRSAG